MIQAVVSEPVLARVARNEQGAVEECMARYEGLIWSLTRRFCSNRADAEDVVQDIFVEIWRSAGRYDATRGSETTFISVIARRELIDRCRAAQRGIRSHVIVDQDEIVSPREPLVAEQRDESIRAARSVSCLGASEQVALGLAIDRGLTQTAIAKCMDLPVGTVKTHVRRGLLKLRWMMEANNGRGRGTGASAAVAQGAA